MFGKKEPSSLENEFERVMEMLDNYTVDSDEYRERLDVVSRLHKMRMEESPDRVSKNTLVLAGTNILGILLIIRYEHVNVITSRAINMLMNPR